MDGCDEHLSDGCEILTRRIRRTARWGIAVIAFIDCWISRYSMNPDGVSYLDIGDAYWRGDWHNALNVYWSPMYSWLTGLMIGITRPAMRWEFPEVHLLNFGLLFVTLFSFEFLWRELLRSHDGPTADASTLRRPWLWALGYLLFGFVHLAFHPLSLVTPDLLVAAIVYFVSALVLRFCEGRMSIVAGLGIGLVLGAGYLAKTAGFLFAAFCLTAMLIAALRRRGGYYGIAAATLGFILVAMPFVAALSHSYGRFTLGDSGKLNHAWFTNRLSVDEPPRLRMSRAQILFDQPRAYGFAGPVEGTDPFWYDPTYWAEGVDTRVHAAKEILQFRHVSVRLAALVLADLGAPSAIVLFLFLLSERPLGRWRRLAALWPILLPSAAMLASLATVAVSSRLVSCYVLVILAAFAATDVGEQWAMRARQERTAVCVLALFFAFAFTITLMRDRTVAAVSKAQLAVANSSSGFGLQAGDRVAILGDALEESGWVRLCRMKIVADLPDGSDGNDDSEAEFWTSPEGTQRQVLGALAGTGTRAAVANRPPRKLPQGWRPINGTGHAIYVLSSKAPHR